MRLDVMTQTAYIVAYAVAYGITIDHWHRGEALMVETQEIIPLLLKRIACGDCTTVLVCDHKPLLGIMPQFREVNDALKTHGGRYLSVYDAIMADTPISQILRTLVAGCVAYHQSLTSPFGSAPLVPLLARRTGAPGGGIPYGYRSVPVPSADGPAARAIVIDEDAANAVRRIFALRRENHSLDSIALVLINEGYRTALGSLFSAKHVSRVLHRQALYLGRQAFSSWRAGQYPPILTDEDIR